MAAPVPPPSSTPSPTPAPAPSSWAVAHAKEIGFFPSHVAPGAVEVVLVTDPWSVWCWGFEPVRRALELRYPTISFRAHVGGMFEELPDPAQVGFNVERFFSTVQRTTGMPLRVDATRGDRPKSTYPACIHVHAVRLLRPDLEMAYLRALREAVYLDGKNVSRREVATDLAAQVGVSRDEFAEALDSGEPAREFRENLRQLEAGSIQAYPTYLVRARDRVVRVEGYQTLPSLLSIVEGVSGRLHPARPAPDVEALVPAGERVATREIAEVLDISVERAVDELLALSRQGLIQRERHANGDVWARKG